MKGMLGAALRTSIALMLLLSAIVPIDSHAAGLGGSWEGQVTQDDPPSTYPMEMNLYGKIGNINYPTLQCGGNLDFINTDGTSYWYRENITFGKGKCIDGGIIQMSRLTIGDDTSWDWKWVGGGVVVRGVIRGSGKAE